MEMMARPKTVLKKSEEYPCVHVNRFLTILCGIYFAISAFEGYLNQYFGSLTKYYLIGLIVVFLFSYKTFYLGVEQVLMLGWLFIKVMSIFWSNGSGMDVVMSHALSQFGMVAFFIVMTCVSFDQIFVHRMVFIMLMAGTALSVLSFFFSDAYVGVEVRQVLTLFGAQIDPNNLAALELTAATIAMYYIFVKKKNSVLFFLILVINVVAMMLTASRGGLVSLGAVILCFLFFSSNGKKNAALNLLIKLILFGICCFIIYLIVEKVLPEDIYQRLFDFESYEGGSFRTTLWTQALQWVSQRPFFGLGWGGYQLTIHNTYIEMLCDVGLVGTSFFLCVLGIIGYKSIKSKNVLAIALLVTGFVPSFFIGAINKRFFWNAIIISMMVLRAHSNMSSKVEVSLNKN